MQIWIQYVQQSFFGTEIADLSSGKILKPSSKLIRLNPFIDSNQILRVGGRLQHARISYDERHPIILPKNGLFTNLLVTRAHLRTLHGGASLTLSHLRREYWIIDARNAIRFVTHRCIRCFRHTTRGLTQLMAELPEPRVNVSRPFLHTGVDHAGPIDILTKRARGKRQTTKGYICLFVRLATKAIHLELVSDLTTNAFLADFRRFSSRRGLPVKMMSDNGTTFVGADHQMDHSLSRFIHETEPEIAALAAHDGVTWSFIPPAAPHFGGLWEAGVKSTKYHLKRILGNAVQTFEEMATTLTEIEGCLNSRPLCPMTTDPNDLTALTPAHFLTGGSLLVSARPSVLNDHINRLNYWQQTQRLVEHFCNWWTDEYLRNLQQRPKWLLRQPNLAPGDMVLVRDDRVPPSKWNLGRVVSTNAGMDNLVRSAIVKTANSTMIRPITKLCLLPMEKSPK